MAEEFKGRVGVNALWPRTTIATAAVQNLLGGDEITRRSRTPDIMGDAAYYILSRDAKTCTGNFFMDDEVLISEGFTDLSKYSIDPSVELMPDFFV
jgi:citronellol/citronellal dehydrogenase